MNDYYENGQLIPTEELESAIFKHWDMKSSRNIYQNPVLAPVEVKVKTEKVKKTKETKAKIDIADPQPWSEEVNGQQMFEEIADIVRRFIYFERPVEAYAVAAWIIFTHCFDEFSISPYLCVHAPRTECGKTTLLKIILQLARRPIPTVNLSSAAMFRVVEEYRPTLVIDELKKFLEENQEFLGILLSGHERDMAFVLRCEGDNQDVKRFSTWGPKAYGMIGMPPDMQLQNRSVIVHLTRKSAMDIVESWPIVNPDPAFFEPFVRSRRQIIRWVKDNARAIRASRPNTQGLINRAADNWTPLFMIADTIGESALENVQSAIVESYDKDDQEETTLVLRDVANIFYTWKLDRLPTDTLVHDLIKQTTSPWNRCDEGGKPIDSYYLGKLLRAYGIKPKQYRYEEQSLGHGKKTNKQYRGYALDQFKDAFQRFLAGYEPEAVEISRNTQDEPEADSAPF